MLCFHYIKRAHLLLHVALGFNTQIKLSFFPPANKINSDSIVIHLLSYPLLFGLNHHRRHDKQQDPPQIGLPLPQPPVTAITIITSTAAKVETQFVSGRRLIRASYLLLKRTHADQIVKSISWFQICSVRKYEQRDNTSFFFLSSPEYVDAADCVTCRREI